MCGKPPFEGVVDQTGKGMFNKIMETRLDINPLLAHGVSTQAIDLMCAMLNTDPAKRPTEINCLQHPWLFDGRKISASQVSRDLRPISEEEEGAITVEGQAKAFSQLSVQDALPSMGGAGRQLSNVDEEEYDDELPQFDSGDLDFLDPRKSKRMKADRVVPRQHVQDQAAIPSSSPKLSPTSENEDEDGLPIPGREPKSTPRLFGEIGNSALEDSGVLGEKTNAALDMPSDEMEGEYVEVSKISFDVSEQSYQAGQTTSELYRSDSGLLQHPSLMGTESELRDLHMMEPPNNDIGTSGDASDFMDEPQTPPPPDEYSENSYNTKSPHSQATPRPQDLTPRQQNRQVAPSSLCSTLPPQVEEMNGLTAPIPYEERIGFQSGPLLGKLTTTPDSMCKITLHLQSRISHWGRAPGNTFVYADPLDVRISKRAFIIWFHAYGIEKEEREGRDWRLMPGIRTLINTDSSTCIWVNDEKLTRKDTDGEQMCGRLYTGDVIKVFDSKNSRTGSQQCLKFVCEFGVGEAEARRPEDLPFKAERAVEPSHPRQSF
jgi:serine/threonine protein kinase